MLFLFFKTKTLKFFFVIFGLIRCSEISKDGKTPIIVTKTDWGGRISSQVDYALIPIGNVIIHHTVTGECYTDKTCEGILKSIQNYHIDELDYPDIGYNFLVGGNGKIYEGRGWHKVGAHTFGYNSRSIGVAFIGDFRDKLPTVEQLEAAKNLLKYGVRLGELSESYKLFGAKQVSATVSPGRRLFYELKKWEHFSPTI